MKFHVKFHGSFMEKITNKKNSQKKISMKFLVELKGTFMEFFWIRNYVNYQSELFARENKHKVYTVRRPNFKPCPVA